MKLVLLLALASPSPLPLSSPLLSSSPVVTSPLIVADELFEKRGVSGAGEEAALAALQSYKTLVEASPSDRARERAHKTLQRVYERIGFIRRG